MEIKNSGREFTDLERHLRPSRHEEGGRETASGLSVLPAATSAKSKRIPFLRLPLRCRNGRRRRRHYSFPTDGRTDVALLLLLLATDGRGRMGPRVLPYPLFLCHSRRPLSQFWVRPKFSSSKAARSLSRTTAFKREARGKVCGSRRECRHFSMTCFFWCTRWRRVISPLKYRNAMHL